MEEIRARISFKTGLLITMLGFLFVVGGAVAVSLMALPELSAALFTMTMGDEVRRAFFLSGSIATVIIGGLLFYIGFDKIRQKLFMEVLRRGVESPRTYREPPEY
ncbi:MAG: hypothetical protein ACE5IJ_06385 [Thermoplasmata archaeon]